MDLPFPSPPFASLDQSDPFTTHSTHHRGSSTGGSIGGAGGSASGGVGAPVYPHPYFSRSQSDESSSHAHIMPLPAPSPPPPSSPFTPPRLLRARGSETGSIFHESVWPPPSAASQMMDPLTSPSQSVNLARIITDVMGPPEADPMLLLPLGPSSREQGQGQGQEKEQEQGVRTPDDEGGDEGEGERRGAMIPPPSFALAPTNPDDLSPRSDLQSSPPSSPPEPLRPPEHEPEPRPETPPSTPWLSRPLHPSPRSSQLRMQP